MKKLLLPAIILLALALRIIIPWHEILGGECIKFACPDGYYFMRLAITEPPSNPWAYILQLPAYLFSSGRPTQHAIEITAVFIPPILAAATIGLVYLIGEKLFGRTTGLLAALILAILPGEFYGRSILGATDYHVAEVFLTTSVIAFIVLGERENRVYYGILAFLYMVFYSAMWSGCWLFIGLLGLYAIVKVWLQGGKWRIVAGSSVVVGIGIMWYFKVFYLISGIDARVFQETLEAASSFSLPGLVNFFLPKCLLALALLWLVRRNALLVVWTLVMVGATLWQIRFDYYLAVPLSLLMGYGLYRFYEFACMVSTSKMARNAVIALLIAFTAFSGVYYSTIHISDTTPPTSLCHAFEWLKENTEKDAEIAVWWDYGYWVDYMAERKAVANNGQSTPGIIYIKEIMSTGGGFDGYIVVDKRTADGLPGSYASSLYQNEGDDRFKQVYSSEGVKIYKGSK